MSTYQSRHQPRRQAVISGKIRSAETYDRYYDITHEAIQRGTLPHFTLTQGRCVVRVLDGKFGIDAARTIAPGSSLNTGNRYSGPRLDGRPGQGALYIGTLAGVLREHAHYSQLKAPASRLGPPPAPALWQPGHADRTRASMQGLKSGVIGLGGKKIHLFRLACDLRFADLRITSIAPLVQRLIASGEAAGRYGIAAHASNDLLSAAASDAQDYSAARGMADAVYDLSRHSGDVGVCAYSARADRDSGLVLESHGDPTGGLVFAIFGSDGTLVKALEPARPAASFDTFEQVGAAMA